MTVNTRGGKKIIDPSMPSMVEDDKTKYKEVVKASESWRKI